MSLTTLFWVLVTAALVWARWVRNNQRRRGLNAVAKEFDLETAGAALDGTVDGRQMRMWRVTSGLGRSRRSSLRFELELLTVPNDLRLETEGVVSTLSRVVGFHDLEVGDAEFDDAFLLRVVEDYHAVEWLTDDRRRELLSLHEKLEQVAVYDRFLEFEIPADPHQEEELRTALRFARVVAARLDDPESDVAPPKLELYRQREKRSKWVPLWYGAMVVVPIALFVAISVSFYVTFIPSPEERARAEENRARVEAQAARRGGGLLNCVNELEKTWDVDLESCSDEAAAIDSDGLAAVEALEVYHRLRIRKASRVELDRARAEESHTSLSEWAAGKEGVLGRTVRLEDGTTRRSSYEAPDSASLARLAWDAGLMERYANTESYEDPVLPDTARAVATLGGRSAVELLGGRDIRSSNQTSAVKCLHGVEPGPVGPSSYAVRAACRKLLHDPDQRARGRGGRLSDDETMVAVLEAEFEGQAERIDQRLSRSPGEYPNASLYLVAVRLASGSEVTDERISEVVKIQQPLLCGGAWSLGHSFGRPEVWEKAAESAGPLATRMRTLAALQSWHKGDLDETPPRTTESPFDEICAAQLDVARGDHALALQRLGSLEYEPALEPLVRYTRAQAHFVAADWQPAAREAAEAARGFGTTFLSMLLRQRAALFAIAAQLRASDDDVAAILDAEFGETPSFDQLDADPVTVARWFAAQTAEGSEAVRWGAPAELPLLPGAEVAAFYLAGELAESGDREYWLDVVMPESFDPYGIATGRALAAELRRDADAAAQWRAVEKRLLDNIGSAPAVRLRHAAFPTETPRLPSNLRRRQ